MSAHRNIRVRPQDESCDVIERPRRSNPAPRPAHRTDRTDSHEPKVARRFLVLWTAAILAASAALVAHLALRFETVRLGYEVGHARQARAQRIEQRRLLSIEAATLRQAARVETVARGSLDMVVPSPENVVSIGARRRASGRFR